MRKSNNGFTIVEIVVTVVVISVLVAVAFFGYTRVQMDSRNSVRSSRVKIMIEALENYYAKKGEYPSCAAMTQNGNQVSADVLPGIEVSALTTPTSPAGTTNSITCTPLSSGSGSDVYAYVGDGSTTCATGNACLQYTLQYRDETNGTIVSADSRHRTQVAATTGSTLTATPVNTTQINLSWTAANNALTYTLQRADDTNFSTNLVTSSNLSGTSTSATSLTPGKTYYFRVAAVGSTGQGTWSNTASTTTTINPPGTPTMSAALNGTNAEGTVAAVTCASGTVEYRINYRYTNVNGTPSWQGWTSWGTAAVRSVAALQGYQYGFQAEARCTGPNASSSSVTSNIPTVVRPISTPAAPTYLSPASFDSPNHAIVNYAGSCPTGTNTINATFRSRAWTGSNWGPNPWGFDDWWTNNTGSNKNVEYWGKYQCQTYYSTSAVSPESYNVIVVTP